VPNLGYSEILQGAHTACFASNNITPNLVELTNIGNRRVHYKNYNCKIWDLPAGAAQEGLIGG